MSAYRLSHMLPLLSLGRAAAGLESVVRLLIFVNLLAMTIDVFAGVVSRYVFNDAFSWTAEFAVWSFTWLIFLGAALGIRQQRHVAADFLTKNLSGWSSGLLGFIQSLILALTVMMMMFSGYQLAEMVGGVSASLEWPKVYKYAVIPVFGLIGLVFLLARDADNTRTLVRNFLALGIAGLLYLGLDHGLLAPLQGVSPSLIMLVAFFVALVVGVPVSFSLMFGVFLANSASFILPAPAIVQNMVTGSTKFILLAIPFFLSTGYLLNLGGLSTRLIDFASSLVGHLRGGLAHVNVLNSLMVGGISGSSSADAASSTKILVPEMVQRGYSPAFSCAVTASSAILPNVVPPAIAMLVYASVANVSIARLFMAGILPAILCAGVLMGVSYLISVRRQYQTATARAPWNDVWRSFLRALPVLVITVGVLGGIRFGIITATEAGVIALLWTFVLGKFVFREYGWKKFYRAFAECGTDAALVGFLIAASVPFAWVLIAEQVPQEIVAWASTIVDGQLGLFIILLVVLAAAGMFLDLTPAMLIIAPLFLPMMTNAGVDPVQLGIIMIIVLQLGGVSPPVGLLVFISSQIAKVSPSAVFRAVVPFIAGAMVVVVLLCLFPFLTVGLWELLG